MIRFHHKSDLILWLDANTKHRAIKRAIWTGETGVLGGFSLIPPGTFPGWVVKITSRTGKVWFIAVTQNSVNGKLYLSEINKVPWKNYIGTGTGEPSLINGDDPIEMERLKNESNGSEDNLSQD